MFGRRRHVVAPLSGDPASPPRGVGYRERERLVRHARDHELGPEARGRSIRRAGSLGQSLAGAGDPADLLIAGPGEPKLPDEVFPHLRWGGRFVYVGAAQAGVRRLAEAFDDRRGFTLEGAVHPIRVRPLGLPLPGLGTRGWCFHARKTSLIQPGEVTDRFTYDVHLAPAPPGSTPGSFPGSTPGSHATKARGKDSRRGRRGPYTPPQYVVTKAVPEHAELLQRLRVKYPQVDVADLDKRAHKLIDHVFPTFLTREAAILKLLQRDLPEPFRDRVPRCLSVVQDKQGLVRQMTMNWLRIGGKPITQLQFARQATELLRVIHERARIMHLDLRLDNMVITERGVGFVDFGSAVRLDEPIHRSPMLSTLFSEMMRTSHIQRMLGRMLEDGRVTSHVMADVHGKADKTVDAFYLAVQINKPTSHPELAPLVRFDPTSPQARSLEALTAAILRPKNPHTAEFKTAGDILRGIDRIERRLSQPTRDRPVAADAHPALAA